MAGEPELPDDASEIRRNGWRQGSVLPAPLVQALSTKGMIPEVPAGTLLIVASHDCDVTHRSFRAEPIAELLIARPIHEIDGNRTRGKSGRVLHLQLRTPSARAVELVVGERVLIDRRLFLGVQPDNACTLELSDRRLVGRWLAKRYDRAALPDAFNDRVSAGLKGIKKHLERTGAYIDQIYVAVAEDELGVEDAYDIVIRAVMNVEDFEDSERRTDGQRCVDRLAELLNSCAGIAVLEAELVSESEFSLDDLRRMKRWDFDFLSVDTASTETP